MSQTAQSYEWESRYLEEEGVAGVMVKAENRGTPVRFAEEATSKDRQTEDKQEPAKNEKEEG